VAVHVKTFPSAFVNDFSRRTETSSSVDSASRQCTTFQWAVKLANFSTFRHFGEHGCVCNCSALLPSVHLIHYVDVNSHFLFFHFRCCGALIGRRCQPLTQSVKKRTAQDETKMEKCTRKVADGRREMQVSD
jgi:hypothetical protein